MKGSSYVRDERLNASAVMQIDLDLDLGIHMFIQDASNSRLVPNTEC